MKKLFFAVFSAFAALALLISIGAYRTQAKELTSQVKISQLQAEGDKISYHWEIDGGVEVGDTFKISMPEDVSFASKVFSSMKNASGEEIATGQVSEDGKTLTITFVKGGNKGASGNVSFWYKWDKENTTGKDQDRTLKVGSESVIVKRSGTGPVPVLLPIKKYNSGGIDHTTLQHAQKIWGPLGIPDWRDTLTVTDPAKDGFLYWHISVNSAVDKKAPASGIVFTDQMPNLPALDFSRLTSAKGQDVSQYFKGGYYLPASFDLKVNGKTFVVDGKPMSGLGLEPYIEWTARGFKLDLTKISDKFKVESTDEITLSYQTLLQHADQIKSVTNVASLTSDQHKTSVSKENTWVNKAASADAQVFNSDVTTTTTTTTSTTTTTESTTTSTTTTTPESTTSTTTTTPESTTSTTTTTPESTTSTTTTQEPSTTTTTTPESTTSTTTTTPEEPTSQNSSEEESSSTTTTTPEPTTSTTTTTPEEPTTTSTTTTPEEPTTTESTTTPQTTMPYYPGTEPTTTSTTTPSTTPGSNDSTTPGSNGSTSSTTPGEATTDSTTGDEPGLPNTGERNGLIVSVAGVAMLIVAVGTILHYRKK
ncbi:LPXTG cell wall anchor domain-containing protein [Streptococcus mitis]|uniref:LPXTG cell wall anchor domain-containing protein n=1 Tax=Streptococcus mitis TaxID=28037 RepID=UPI0035697A77